MGLPTPMNEASGDNEHIVYCLDCPHRAEVDRAEIVAAGYGDVPWIRLPFVCIECGSRRFTVRMSPRNTPRYSA